MQDIVCPKCGERLHAVAFAKVPDAQRLSLRVTLRDEATPFLDASEVASIISATSEALKETAKGMGESVAVAVSKIAFNERVLDVDFVALSIRKRDA